MEKTAPTPRNLTWLGLLLLPLLFWASVALVSKADGSKAKDWNQDRITYLPSGKQIKAAAMGFDEAVADLLWIQAMMYFADAYLSGKSYAWLGHMLDVVTQLNPHMHPAFEFAGVSLTKDKAQLPKALKILDRGLESFPRDWRLRLYASMAQLAHDSDFTKAAEYLKPVTLDPDAPNHIRTLCATFVAKGEGRKVALAFLVDRYMHSSNAINQEIFIDKILRLYPGPVMLDLKRKQTVEKILREISIEPAGELIGLGVMHQYLADSLTENGRKLLDLLNN